MLAAREVAIRVSGMRVTNAAARTTENGPELIITVPLLGDFVVDDSFELEVLELLLPCEMRQRLPNGGWRRVSLRILIALLRSGLIRVTKED
jgi:hypothetical protein